MEPRYLADVVKIDISPVALAFGSGLSGDKLAKQLDLSSIECMR